MECRACHRQVSVTAGTIFHRSRKPLRLWFKAVRPGREPLTGRVEVDDGFVGGEEAGVHGRETKNIAVVAVAVEVKGQAAGRLRMKRVEDASAASLSALWWATWCRTSYCQELWIGRSRSGGLCLGVLRTSRQPRGRARACPRTSPRGAGSAPGTAAASAACLRRSRSCGTSTERGGGTARSGLLARSASIGRRGGRSGQSDCGWPRPRPPSSRPPRKPSASSGRQARQSCGRAPVARGGGTHGDATRAAHHHLPDSARIQRPFRLQERLRLWERRGVKEASCSSLRAHVWTHGGESA